MTIYTTKEIISKRYYTDDCDWINTYSIAIAINKCNDDEIIFKTDLLKKLLMDNKYEVIESNGKILIVAKP